MSKQETPSTGRRARSRRRAGLAIASGLALMLWNSAAAQQIRGTLSNFDAHNLNNQEMTNLELDLRNIEPAEVLGFYNGPNSWGAPPIVRDIGGTEVTWADFRNPILPGGMQHFGLQVAPGTPAPCGVQAYWTRHVKVVEIPVPWQTWRPEPGVVVDVIRLNPDFAGGRVLLNREFSVRPLPAPLDELVWDNPDLGPWLPVAGDPVALGPGEETELIVPFGGGGGGAVLVRYTVALEDNADNVITRFVNEAEIAPGSGLQTPVIVGTLSNFDVHNDTGKPVHDLELDLLNVMPGEVLDWYRGPDAWGLFPDTNAPAIGTIPGGMEVNWVDERHPIPYCETRHFGLVLNPNLPAEPLVRAFWTRVVKVWQIPVPWQWWQTQAGDLVTDVIQLSDTFDAPVFINRQWATMPTAVPLSALLWDNPTIPWQTDPAGTVRLEPGDQAFLNVLPGSADEAVLVRYTVAREETAPPEVRFVNEALLGPAGSRQIVGSLSNFDAINLTPSPVTNLEMDFRTIDPAQFLGWYPGWGAPPIIARLPQTEVSWVDFLAPLPFCQTRHFGLELSPGAAAPCGVQAYWTRHEKVVEIPVPWQTWSVPPVEPPTVVDRIRLNPDFAGPVLVARQFATLPVALPLDELYWDNTAIPWQPAPGDPVLLSPGQDVPLTIPVSPPQQGVLVRYSVQPIDPLNGAEQDIVTRFVNQASLDWGAGGPFPSIVGSLSNFDAHNLTGKPVHDLELDIQGIAPENILGWYRGPDAWGIDPVVRWTADGTATEVTWIDDRNPMAYCETRHFGLALDPNVPVEPLVRAFWTREVKVRQIPVPWQFWIVPRGSVIRDVVQLSDTFDRPVTIRRDFALVTQSVPLDELNWDLAAPWQPDPRNPISLQPGFQADLDIPVDPWADGAVLVRYEVTDSQSGEVVTRFVNEALLGPGVISGLHFETSVRASWNPYPLDSVTYDMVRGDVASLRQNGGVLDGTCRIDSFFDVFFDDPEVPDPGQGFYYLVRMQDAAGVPGTYDSTADPAEREGRDLEIGPGDCD